MAGLRVRNVASVFARSQLEMLRMFCLSPGSALQDKKPSLRISSRSSERTKAHSRASASWRELTGWVTLVCHGHFHREHSEVRCISTSFTRAFTSGATPCNAWGSQPCHEEVSKTRRSHGNRHQHETARSLREGCAVPRSNMTGRVIQ